MYADANALVPYYLSDLLLLLSYDLVVRLFWSDYLIKEVCDVDMLAAHGIEVQTPDTFLLQLLLETPNAVLDVIKRRQVKLWNPLLGLSSYVNQLSKSVPMFASALGAHLELL